MDQFFTETTERFRDGLNAMLTNRSDTFSFEFPLSAIPGWEMRAEAERAGLAPDTLMTLVVLVRPKAVADPMLEAMAQVRDADIVEAL